MANSYTRMLLVRPDLLEKKEVPIVQSESDPQSSYYANQQVRERLTPNGGLVQILSHLQNKVHHILNAPNIETSSRLRKYNQLMTKSAILMKKARVVGRSAVEINPQAFSRQGESDIFADSLSGRPTASDTDSDDETFVDAASRGTPEPLADETPFSGVSSPTSTRHMDDNIRRVIPASYRPAATKLYKLIATKGAAKGINWNSSGELVIRNEVIRGTNIVDLLADATRPKSTQKIPVGRDIFAKVLKSVNPTLKHVKNKAAFTTEPKKKAGQTGQGLKIAQIKWRTKL